MKRLAYIIIILISYTSLSYSKEINCTSRNVNVIDADTIKLTNVDLPKLPPELNGIFDVNEWFRVYVNGVLVPNAKYSYTGSQAANEIYFNFGTGSLDGEGNYVASSTELGYILENTDEFGVTGKFIEL